MDPIIYLTHDNGGRPFKVAIYDNKNIKIFKNMTGNKKKLSNKDIILFDLNPVHFFVGLSPYMKMTEFSGGVGPDFVGNSILIQLDNNNNYQFVGDLIYTFTSLKKIISFCSPVGNNDVPYPYATDEDGNNYLFLENVVILNSDFYKKTNKNYETPYDYFYDYDLITSDLGIIPPKEPNIRKYEQFFEFNNIKEYHVGDEQYTLRYKTHIRDENEQIYIVDNNNNQQYLTNDEFKSLIQRFGDTIGFHKLTNLNLLVKRQ